ncbi:GNAT family N-acetyltransferase [Neptunomonas qingdaonensis]|uniref:Peptidogalycan biosysnthesis/recognition n=1 Tax=Neptunomonas qingdaonensis TaxID=1045558 RepID=A0A1I2RYE3_9GAMM|nr:GNAT family N-acetyltransferase [Neptunomonas qingdaonensis]SFG42766.1 hypothetical protein SAMN05216175_106237 [Neptunomonas qingdaonensis]
MTYSFDLSQSISHIGLEGWNRLAGTSNPFLRYEFLEALESSGAVTSQTGWQPLHLRLYEDDSCIAILPLYLKSHSYGEYVFDWAWADAYQRHGLDYYPKLLTSIPFSPVSGPRIATNKPVSEIVPILTQVIRQISIEKKTSSWHGLFLPQNQQILFENEGFQSRLGTQFHWFNRDYTSFEHFLQSFSSRKRKNVKRERRKVADQGVSIRCFEGAEITETLLKTFYRCYHLTYLKRGRQGYLNQDFFMRLIHSMPEQLVLFAAEYNAEYVATALCLKDDETLYGRYWGCLEEFDSLHFETCFYTGIEYCIKHGLKRFDPGAQGEHKIQRGFEPIKTWSSHYISNPSFSNAIAHFLQEETPLMDSHIAELAKGLPFKHEE